jgi:hypothetical protein
MIAVLQDEGFAVEERDVNRIRKKNGWLLRLDTAHYQKKRPAPGSQFASPEEDDSNDDDEDDVEVVAGCEGLTGTPDFGSPLAGLPEMDFTQAQAEAFQEARKRAMAAEAEEKRVTKKRRRWLKGRAGLPADPPGPPRFPSELSLTESKALLSLDAATYKDIRAKFREICEREGVAKKTVAGPQKWEAVKLQVIRDSMHLRAVFWDNLNVDQKNLALDVICCDVAKNIRSEGSRMLLHEARNILELNPKLGRDVRFHFQKILHEDHFVGKIVAGEEHWNELVQRWLGESNVLAPIAASLGGMDPDAARKSKKAIDVVARDAMKRFRDDVARGTIAKMLEHDLAAHDNAQEDDAKSDRGRTADSTVMETSVFDDGTFDAAQAAAQIAAQLTVDVADDSAHAVSGAAVPTDGHSHASNSALSTDEQVLQLAQETPAPPKRKRGRPRKLPIPDTPAETATSAEPPAKKQRGRQSNRIPQEEALRIYMHSQARFLPPDGSPGQGSSASAELQVADTQVTPTQPAVAGHGHYTRVSAPSPSHAQPTAATPAATPAHYHAAAHLQASTPVRTQVTASGQRAMTAIAIYFRLQPTSTVTGVPAMWIATLTTRTVTELRTKAEAKSPGALCLVIDGIVKDGMGGEIPLPVPGDTELSAYLDHMREIHGPPTFSVQLVHPA